ncbi:DUF4097 family beta strand repeat-containing protein [Nocardia sp. NBC_01503]|uniref:DUF4097 family beta strand repeat-containing protein n=1 Tax=Nocardia sp. NBC_01503 TaxID=2975997 RepID=UPI002E7B4314|nr:DUF4097 family beta strand repeat-containing protein [Nocardia sp. NBC_01503]WTL35519.1 DUF4097 family beta strand repeat-containing protein [Nocardia sp. NBC_01503]
MPTFQTPGPIAITADIPSGEVKVIASGRTDTVVTVRPADPSEKDDVRAADQVRIDYAAGHLSVVTPKSWRTYTPFGGNPTIEVIIEAPTGSQLRATAGMGRLSSTGELGDCDLEIAAGDIEVGRTTGSVTAKTSKGDIRIAEATRGTLHLETSMGELEVGITPGSAAQLESNTQHGSVQNQLQPVSPTTKDIVHVHARNSYGNIIIRHANAA